MTCRNSTNFKVCTQCKTVKALSEFYKHKSHKDGMCSECKQCTKKNPNRKINKHRFRKTKKGIISAIFDNQTLSCVRRNHKPQNYTRDEFRMWALSKKEFHTLYDQWVESGYCKKSTPSCDRIDDYKSYTFDNIQWMAWSENNNKGYADRKNGVNNKQSKAVEQLTLDGSFVKRWYSAKEAERNIPSASKHVNCCCKGNRNIAGGFKWQYAEEK